MADGTLSIGLLKDVADLFERLQSTIMLTASEKNEIIESVSVAVLLTEGVFGKRKNGSRHITQNPEVAEAWRKAGISIIKYLPNEHLGTWLQNKGEAWANPHKWEAGILEKNNLQIEEIKKRIPQMTSTRRKFFRPKDI
ncbi:hypothetical protein [Flavobacterium sp. PL002]|uniref:hypothetical protein n=1 Tax=Flavobacterium sp. PL002 TaxID=1897058 RepID=UPI00178807FC|nr:hypothetical protein [Flavobacterium sp. PL002]MBE0391304.1 hypothetical protein [Flavobacterium sp. PL002]